VNVRPATTPFPAAEYEARLERARAQMERDRIDALVLTSRPNFDYFTGLSLSQPWAVPTRALFVVLPLTGEPVLIAPEPIGVHAEGETWIRDVRSYQRIDRADRELVAEVIRECSPSARRLGFELAGEQRVDLTPADFDALRASLADVDCVDASPLIWQLRMRKTPAEIEQLRTAIGAGDAALVELLSGSRLGWSEREALRYANSVALRSGADETGFHAITSGKGSYHRTLAGARDRVLKQGDMLWLDLGVRTCGYWSDACRAGVVGGPTAHQARMQQAIVAATWAGVEMVEPGQRVAAIAKEVFARRDAIGDTTPVPIGRAGHGLGLCITEPPHLADWDDTTLEAGMVITIEPFVHDESGLYCCEEIVLVTDDGHEVLTTAPRELSSI
jgi:Xaa-Pro aminopeptidase